MSERHLFSADYDAGLYAGYTVESMLALLSRPHPNPGATKALTGCVSEISSVAPTDRLYTGALQAYAVICEAAQAYLAPGEGAITHDYAECAQGQQDGQEMQIAARLELLRDGDLKASGVSDEEVERCGYLGWLRH